MSCRCRHLLRLDQLLLQAALLGDLVEQHEGAREHRHREGRGEEAAVAVAQLRRWTARLGQDVRQGVLPGGGNERDPLLAGEGGDRGFDEIGEHAVPPPYRAVRVHDADRLRDAVDGDLPLVLADRQQLQQMRVLEGDRDLRHHGIGVEELGFPIDVGPVPPQRDGPDGASGRGQGDPDPGPRRIGHVDAPLARRGTHVARIDQGPLPEGELEEGSSAGVGVRARS
jgi:hypothetical protein